MPEALNPELIKLQVTNPEQSSPKGLFVPVVLLPSADTVYLYNAVKYIIKNLKKAYSSYCHIVYFACMND